MSMGREFVNSSPSKPAACWGHWVCKDTADHLRQRLWSPAGLWFPGWLPPHHLPRALGEGDARRPLEAGTVVRHTWAVTPLAWQLPLEPRPSLKIQPKSNFNKVWKPSLGGRTRDTAS